MNALVINPEFRNQIPRLTEEEREQLEANIREHGCRDPLTVWRGVLLDGHNRFEICNRLGIAFAVSEIDLPDEDAAANWIDANQLGRRNLSPDARKLLLGRLYNRVKKAQGAPEGNANRSKQSSHFGNFEKTADKLAADHGVSRNTVLRAGKFAEAVAEVIEIEPELLARGEKDILAAAKAIRAEKQAAKRLARAAKLAELSSRDVPWPDRAYPVIYADPPWEYDFSPSSGRAVENHYPTMPIEDIMGLNVASLATADAMLFLWVPPSFIKKGIAVLEAWGFELASSMVWDKGKIGTGIYFRQQHEYLLLGKRGAPITPKPGTQPPSVLQAPRGAHSEKPAEMYEIIERMYPGLPAIELFSRQPREGWAAWGNEAVAA